MSDLEFSDEVDIPTDIILILKRAEIFFLDAAVSEANAKLSIIIHMAINAGLTPDTGDDAIANI